MSPIYVHQYVSLFAPIGVRQLCSSKEILMLTFYNLIYSIYQAEKNAEKIE